MAGPVSDGGEVKGRKQLRSKRLGDKSLVPRKSSKGVTSCENDQEAGFIQLNKQVSHYNKHEKQSSL